MKSVILAVVVLATTSISGGCCCCRNLFGARTETVAAAPVCPAPVYAPTCAAPMPACPPGPGRTPAGWAVNVSIALRITPSDWRAAPSFARPAVLNRRGAAIAARIPMIITTTTISISVKPLGC